MTSHEHPGVHADGVSPFALRIAAIRDLLVERGVVTADEIDRTRRRIESRSPVLGAALVARAWSSAWFADRLLDDAHAAAAEAAIELPPEPHVTVLANGGRLHHLVVCTLCSCYPRSLLGRPPDWYKSFAYRSRAVSEPRAVLAEFGVHLDADVTVRVVDSTADHRYLVLPQRPDGTDEWAEADLARLVTRDAMIGAGVATTPGEHHEDGGRRGH